LYRRADLSRTMTFVVALLLTAASTSVFAREFRVADTTVQALHYLGSLVAERSGGRLEGLRIRVQQSAQMSDRIGALGAQPVELPYGQVLTGLVTKLIDGAENNWPSFVTTEHYKFAGYYALTEHTMSPEVLVMSQKAWTSLSAEDQKIFREAAMRSSRFMREKWRDLEERSRKQAEAAGVTIISDVDRKPFEAATAGIYAKADRDPAIAQLIERIRKVE
jgi:TRAP-type C4-dicarboxylate transport system substrate-binding protein